MVLTSSSRAASTRCPYARARCAAEEPPLEFADGHGVACHFWKEIEPPAALVPDRSSIPANPRLERLQAAFGTRAS